MLLNDKVALITGAARGIGRATALTFAEAGADLLLFDVGRDLPDVPYPLGTRDQLEHTAQLCRKYGSAVLTHAGDVRDRGDVADAVGAGVDRFGQIDALVNNAGIVAPSGKPVHEITEREWSVMLDVDLTGAWRTMTFVAPIMAARRAGSIVNIASTAGLVGYRYFAGYVAAKHGLIGLTKAAALDYAPVNVTVNAVCPGSVRDDPDLEGRMLVEMARSLDVPLAEHERLFTDAQPTNALVEPAAVASAALWLASAAARQVTGTVLTVDGGFTAK